MPAASHLVHVFSAPNFNYFNAKPRKLDDKFIPDTLISLKFAKRHVPTGEAKDRIIRETLELLTTFYAANASSLSFPELVVPTVCVLRKFKKNVSNGVHKKQVQTLLDLIAKNEVVIAGELAKLRDLSLRDPAKLT